MHNCTKSGRITSSEHNDSHAPHNSPPNNNNPSHHNHLSKANEHNNKEAAASNNNNNNTTSIESKRSVQQSGSLPGRFPLLAAQSNVHR